MSSQAIYEVLQLENAPEPVRDPLLEACRVLGRELGIRVEAPARRLGEPSRPLTIAELCETNGVRHRKVRLGATWWQCDQGMLLAYRSGTGAALRPVALLPGRGGYRLLDPLDGVSLPVNSNVAAGIERDAYVLYRPLPARSLTITDLVRAGFHGQCRELSTIVCATACTGGLALLTPWITRWIVDSSIPSANRTELWQVISALAVGAVAATLFELVRALTLLRLKTRSAVSLQAALWDRLLAMPLSFFRRFTVGDLVSRSTGVDHIQRLLTCDVAGAVFALLSSLFSLAILFRYSWPLALIATASALLLAVLTVLLARRQLRHLRVVHKLNGNLAALVYSLLSGIAKLRISGAEKRGFTRWAEGFNTQRAHSIAVRRLSNLQSVIALAIATGTPLVFFVMVAYSARIGLGLGEYLAFNAAYAQFQAAVLAAVAVIPAVLGFVPTYERMQPILDTEPECHRGQSQPGILRGAIELRNVSFAYPDGPPVLKDVSLTVRPGEFVAIVGPSGSGKSTCLRLMLGFEKPKDGIVLIDDDPVDSLNMHLVRREMGVVLQNGRPLAGDIFHNIVGSLPLTLDDAWRAASFVGLDDEIRSMPMSMFTLVNARGVAFSGGQRQRLLLARAVVRHPRILLLDEATSALDNRTQDLITCNLTSLGATRVVVAHRLSTIRNADRIYVLDHGEVVEQGTFDELLRAGNLFSRMAERQML